MTLRSGDLLHVISNGQLFVINDHLHIEFYPKFYPNPKLSLNNNKNIAPYSYVRLNVFIFCRSYVLISSKNSR